MQERYIEYSFIKFLTGLKKIPLSVEYVNEPDNTVSAWNDEINISMNAPNYEECHEKLVRALKEFADYYFEALDDWYAHNPELLPYVLKIKLMSDEELRECLSGQN